ncbi:unnamed protein product [Cyclocybe aegerita]|uniref:WD repeat-containing protein 75 second beta-propeller domain-containing protein n=1 Tax=Cyclocybe aegerita TaxID=1973307 RepID=A0A8S0WMC4_CYCAE|nr:unnamed protein product [Cyclocybe aegerita]
MAASTSKPPRSDIRPSKDPQKTPSKKGKGKENSNKPASTSTHSPSWEEDTPWIWASLTDPSSSRVAPVFTKDGSYFFSLIGSSVKIYSTATGIVVSTLTAPASNDDDSCSDILTSAVLNPHNVFQLIVGTLGGRILIWDFVNATLLQTVNVGQPIHYICAHDRFKGSVFVAASRSRKKASSSDTNAIVLQIFIKQSDHTSQVVKAVPVGKIRHPTGLSISANGAWLVASAAHKVYVAKTESLEAGFTKYVSPEHLTCLSFHPSEEYFATGDEKGVIRIWYCLNDSLAVNVRGVEKRTQTRALHWHAHAVSSLTFSPNGAYLLSGGEESVLVIWQLHTGKKEFVPRVGAPISTICVSRSVNGEEEYLLGLADATYTFISSSSLKIVRSCSRIKIGVFPFPILSSEDLSHFEDPAFSQESASTSKLDSVPLAVQPLTSTFILPSSHASSVQIYSPSSSTLIGELEVSPSNRVSRREDKPITPSRVEHAVVSASGLWMATVDRREDDAGFRPEVYLKIWAWDKKEENWVLNTRIDRPHGTFKVVDVSFSSIAEGSDLAFLVTTGEDGLIKVWRLLSHKKDSEQDIWVCHTTLAFRSERPRSVSWSPDASLFSVAVGPHIALYDPVTGSLRHTLTAPQSQTMLSGQFIGRSGRHLLACGTNSLIMWDLIDNEVSWQTTTPVQIEKVIPHPREDSFAVIHSPIVVNDAQRTKVSIFRVSSSSPFSVRSVPFGLRNVIWGAFQASAGFSLVGVTERWRVIVMGDSAASFKDEGRVARGINTTNQGQQKRTLFQDLFGVSAFADSNSEFPEWVSAPRKDNISHDLFSAPAFLMPALDTLFGPLIESFLTVRIAEGAVNPDGPPDAYEDVAMEEAADSLITPNQPPRVPQPGELDMFTKLFRTSCRNKPSLPPKSQVNGKLNGMHLHPKEINGTPRPPLAIAPSTQCRPSSDSDDHLSPSPATPSTPIVNGKKRRKVSR